VLAHVSLFLPGRDVVVFEQLSRRFLRVVDQAHGLRRVVLRGRQMDLFPLWRMRRLKQLTIEAHEYADLDILRHTARLSTCASGWSGPTDGETG